MRESWDLFKKSEESKRSNKRGVENVIIQTDFVKIIEFWGFLIIFEDYS